MHANPVNLVSFNTGQPVLPMVRLASLLQWGWNTTHSEFEQWGSVLFSNGFGFPMVDKMAAILFGFLMVRTIGKQNFWPAQTVSYTIKFIMFIMLLQCPSENRSKWWAFCFWTIGKQNFNKVGISMCSVLQLQVFEPKDSCC